VIVGWYFVVGLAAYGVSEFYPNYLAKKRDSIDNYLATDGDEPVTKTDLRHAANKAAGKDTSFSDGMAIGQGLFSFFGAFLLAFVLPFIAAWNFFRYWLKK
jgi:ABC-type glycerol-3-phosphate transport system substrate-binding protein